MGLRRIADRLRHHARRPLARTPYLWDAAMLARSGKRSTLATRRTALVIEGYLRSGNTYSVAAFIVANGTELHLGRHLHGAPHVLRAARLGVPTVVLVREPRDAMLSYLIRRDTLSPDDALLEYLDFYRTALRVQDSFVVGLFEQVIGDFGAVIDRVNQHYGTTFARYESTRENEAAVFALVEEMNRKECRGELVETHVGRPSTRRSRRKAQLAALLQSPRTASLLRSAQQIYLQYVVLAARQDIGRIPRQPPQP